MRKAAADKIIGGLNDALKAAMANGYIPGKNAPYEDLQTRLIAAHKEAGTQGGEKKAIERD